MQTKAQQASGFQIAFLVFAVLLLAAPANIYVFSRWKWAADLGISVGRIAIFLFAAVLFVGVPRLRQHCARLLAAPIPKARVPEIALIVLLNFAIGLAAFGALALWWLSTGGQRELASHMANPGAAIELDKALSVGSAVTALFVGGLLAPIIEELVFRGMLYRAWEAQWGWIPAAFASSFVFAFLHPAVYISQFLGGLVFVCIYRRTGSLRAPIVTHAVFNVAVWYPLLGRFVLPAGRETGAIDVWVANFVCLGVVAVALPAYMWIARDDEVRRTRGIAPTEPVLA